MRIRTGVFPFIGIILAIFTVVLVFLSNNHISMATRAVAETRNATLQSYRITQSLKSLAAGYELTMNEYYSTVLEQAAYVKKVAAQKAAIDRDLAQLSTLHADNTTTELQRAFAEMDTFRNALERAMSAPDKDWDGAREALYKLNVLSVQAIHQADLLAQNARERADALDQDWQNHQSRAVLFSYGTLGLAVSILLLFLFQLMRRPSMA